MVSGKKSQAAHCAVVQTSIYRKKSRKSLMIFGNLAASVANRISVQGVESLWGDCRFIPAD